MARLIPSDYEEFLNIVGKIAGATDAKSIINGVFNTLISGDDLIKNQVTIAWAKWSWAVLNFSFEKKCEFFIKSPGQIFSNYFLTEEILENAKMIKNIPTTLIHGSRDVMCLPEASWTLSNFFHKGTLKLIHGSGHLSSDPKIRQAMIDVIEEMKTPISG